MFSFHVVHFGAEIRIVVYQCLYKDFVWATSISVAFEYFALSLEDEVKCLLGYTKPLGSFYKSAVHPGLTHNPLIRLTTALSQRVAED